MKTLAFSFLAVAAVALVGYQHQQLGRLRVENTSLQQSASEANQLQADLATSTSDAAQMQEEITRLHEENRDLLKLRNEVSQLHEAQAAFEKVSAENKRLQSQVARLPTPNAKQISMQPITLRIVDLYDRGLSTPENAVQTFYWAQRDRNADALARAVTSSSWKNFRDYTDGWRRQNFDNFGSVEIVARRDLNTTTVQLGVQLNQANNPQFGEKLIITLELQGSDWRVNAVSR